nr:MAG: thymidylate synthase [Diabrotica toursvirus 3a]
MNNFHGEQAYIELLKKVIETGVVRNDRTGTGTKSLFAESLRFNLNTFPLLTGRTIFFRGIVEELLWFLRGDTNSLNLAKKQVHIWDANGSREFLDLNGFNDRKVGDLGPVYGFQWRHFGANYINCDSDYKGKGFDQISWLIDEIKKNPDSRRLILTSWNPTDISKMVLPPCHCMAQFYVRDNTLSCHLYQRSADLALGIPFNIASYSLLTCMIAQVCGLEPKEFVITMGDVHVYLNQIPKVEILINRVPYPFPKLHLNKNITDIFQFTNEDIKVCDYMHHSELKIPFSL